MRKLLLLIALWNTLVVAFNMIILPMYLSPKALMYMTPESQFLPIFIPLGLSLMVGRRLLKIDWKTFIKKPV